MCDRNTSDAVAGYQETDEPRPERSEGVNKSYNPERTEKENVKAARRYAIKAEIKNWSYEQLCKEIERGNQESQLAFDRTQVLISALHKKLGSE